jgi:hypothetical protein
MVVGYLIGWRVRSELCLLNPHSRNENDKVRLLALFDLPPRKVRQSCKQLIEMVPFESLIHLLSLRVGLTILPFSGVVPSVSEDHVRCNGGLGGACPGGTLRARLPIGCRFKKSEEVTLRISTQDMNPVARNDLWFGDQAPSLGDHSGAGIAERRDLNGD